MDIVTDGEKMSGPSAKTFAIPTAALTFLRGLEKNNTKTWFDDHRATYRNDIVEPLKDLAVLLGEAFEKAIPGLNYDPRVNGSIFRLNRDARFSKNKNPYKTNLGVFVWRGPAKKMECPGIYFHLEPTMLMVGSGIYMFTPEQLAIYRRHVDAKGEVIARAVAKGEKAGFALGGEKSKRVPRGFDADHPHAELLKHKGFFLSKEYPAKRATQPGLIPFLKKELAPTVDLVNRLAEALY
jgi:uncharacterized protein (TIGR02453 family)